jgi:hypothetical protein
MTCIVDERDEVEAARRALLQHDDVIGASIAAPREGQVDRWTVECALREGSGGVGSGVLATAAEFGLCVRLCQPRGTAWWALLAL